MEYLFVPILLVVLLFFYGPSIFLGFAYFHGKKQQKSKVGNSVQIQQSKIPIPIPPIGLPQISPVGRNSPPITTVLSPTISSDFTVETDSLPTALEQQQLNNQPEKTPRRRKTRTLSEATSQSVFDLSPAPEGGRKPKTNYTVVRSAKLRKAAIQIHGRNCIACGKNFDEIYGKKLAKGYIEIHHLNSIAAGARNTDPATELMPLCSNCHKMADRLTPPPRTISELRSKLFPASSLPNGKALQTTEVLKSPMKIKIGKLREKKPKKTS
jgi:hypothetical protein